MEHTIELVESGGEHGSMLGGAWRGSVESGVGDSVEEEDLEHYTLLCVYAGTGNITLAV